MNINFHALNLVEHYLFYQGADLPVSEKNAKKNLRNSEIRFQVLDFVNLLTVCYNKFVPVVSTRSVSLCGRVNFLHFKILAFLLC